jgi:hypothetical protein
MNRHQRRAEEARKRHAPREDKDAWRSALPPGIVAMYRVFHQEHGVHIYPSNAGLDDKPLFCDCLNDPRNTETT